MSNQKTLLITGGAGFIGSNFICYFLQKHSDYLVINLDKITYAADLKNLSEVNANKNYKFIKGDICDKQLVNNIFSEHKITGVIHFAAESHVDNSISGPEVFIDTNVKGTFNLLEAARKHWINKDCRFHHISTDEVYGTLGDTGYFTELTPYAPNSPYSASKASSDFIVRSFHHTFGMNTVITNCSNNYGPKQHGEKLIPTVIRKAISEEKIPVYGQGKNTRDWLYVIDHCTAIEAVYHKGKAGETYNIGSRNEKQNIEVVNMICKILDAVKPRNNGKPYNELISYVTDRPGHDWRYAIDPSKLEQQIGWKAEEDFESGLKKTIEFYI